MESENQNQNLELPKVAIKNLIEERRNKETSGAGDDDDDDDDQLLLSRLVSQLESLKEKDEILKEIKKVKRQNVVTHWLVSAMIVVTVGWQVSELSVILKLKGGLSHPFRSVGATLANIFKRPLSAKNDNDNTLSEAIPVLAVPPPNIPDLPNTSMSLSE